MPLLQPVSFTEGGQQPVDSYSIEEKRRLAELLRQQSQQPIVSYSQNSPISWTQGLAQMLNAYGARKKEKEAGEEQRDYQKRLAESLRGGGDLSELADRIGQVNPELAVQLRMEEAKQRAKMQGNEQYGNAPIWGQDKDGNWVVMQPSSGGGPLSVAETPRGVRLARPQYEPGAQYEISGAKQAGKEDVTMQNLPQMNQLTAQGAGLTESAKQAAQIQAIPERAQAEVGAIEIKAPAEAEAEELKKVAAETGKAAGETTVLLADMKARLPRLEEVAKQLSVLGKKATHTYVGRTRDVVKRELGLPVGEGAVARTEYISKVDNEVLPLLRQTFGAAFTAKEGESLKATLGDPNVSPEEKDAVLRSFIDNKTKQIETEERKLKNLQPEQNLTPEERAEYERLKQELGQ